MSLRSLSAGAISFLFLCASSAQIVAWSREQNGNAQNAPAKAPAPFKKPSPEEQLQLAINNAGNDRAALVRNLEAFLKQYPDSRQRPQIYRALAEACLQLRDTTCAANYAERLVAFNPDDISMTILTIQLLERNGDEAALRRAVNYASRVLEFVERRSSGDKSAKISQEEWAAENKRDRISVLTLRGRLKLKLKDNVAAQQDFEASYAVLPNSPAAEQLGEIAELRKDAGAAIRQYARAFALADAANGTAGHREIRQKLGNVWRLAHGSDLGLGEYLLLTFDEVSQNSISSGPRRNHDAKEISDFLLRKAPEGIPYPLKDLKGRVLVVNFWATWCGPCHALEPIFARVAADFETNPDALFLAANCDEDESLVKGYLEEDKPRTPVVFADGLDRFFTVNSYPTVLVIDRAGKIAFRSDGVDPESFASDLTAAVHRALTPLSASPPAVNPAP